MREAMQECCAALRGMLAMYEMGATAPREYVPVPVHKQVRLAWQAEL